MALSLCLGKKISSFSVMRSQGESALSSHRLLHKRKKMFFCIKIFLEIKSNVEMKQAEISLV
jgi:hypothetical protein